MAKISDELRRLANSDIVCGHAWVALQDIADRIDKELVELPKDADGVPIHVGDTVYLSDGRKADVHLINIARDHTSIDFQTCGDGRIFFAIEPTNFTHTQPDSWERIADELDNFADANYASGLLKQGIEDFADRIRKLAKEQGDE